MSGSMATLQQSHIERNMVAWKSGDTWKDKHAAAAKIHDFEMKWWCIILKTFGWKFWEIF